MRPLAAAMLCLGLALAQDPKAGPPDAKKDRKPNRLVHEKSPYLQQHAYDPVDWYPWGAEAFDKAKAEDKPVFLSVGYATCHWCHVMERESFENETIAAFLNEHFVSIKVDREERPDVDEVYMDAQRRFTREGGSYPMSMFLTPDARPFCGGNYFPPEDAPGTLGFLSLLRQIAESWKGRRADIDRACDELLVSMLTSGSPAQADARLDLSPIDLAWSQFSGMFDSERGGFLPAPKFPRSIVLDLLLRYARRTGNRQALAAVVLTLDKMADGGMYDQIGGGFHRFSTDADWLVPHFEKMLYDNALLARTYVGAWQASGDDRYAQVARGVLDYVLDRLTSPEGGFCSAEDADSEGVEGKFYVWTPKEVASVLGDADARVVCAALGIDEKGDFEGCGPHASVLHAALTAEGTSKLLGVAVADVERVLAVGRKKLLEARSKRVRPARDGEILTAWNGLMISALARAGAALEEPRYVDAARRDAAFLLDRCQKDGRLLRRFVDGEARFPGALEDYAFLAEGLLDLYQATFEDRWLDESVRVAREMVRLFSDEKRGGFYHTASDAEELFLRPHDPYDGAVPSGDSVAAGVLLRLALLTGDAGLRKQAEGTIRAVLPDLQRRPTAFPQMLAALEDLLTPRTEMVLSAGPDDPALAPMLRAARRAYLPGAVIMLHPGGDAGEKLEAKYPLLEGRAPAAGARAFVCEGTTCKPQATTPEELRELLSGGDPAASK